MLLFIINILYLSLLIVINTLIFLEQIQFLTLKQLYRPTLY